MKLKRCGVQATAEVLLQDAANDLCDITHSLQQEYSGLDETVRPDIQHIWQCRIQLQTLCFAVACHELLELHV